MQVWRRATMRIHAMKHRPVQHGGIPNGDDFAGHLTVGVFDTHAHHTHMRFPAVGSEATPPPSANPAAHTHTHTHTHAPHTSEGHDSVDSQSQVTLDAQRSQSQNTATVMHDACSTAALPGVSSRSSASHSGASTSLTGTQNGGIAFSQRTRPGDGCPAHNASPLPFTLHDVLPLPQLDSTEIEGIEGWGKGGGAGEGGAAAILEGLQHDMHVIFGIMPSLLSRSLSLSLCLSLSLLLSLSLSLALSLVTTRNAS